METEVEGPLLFAISTLEQEARSCCQGGCSSLSSSSSSARKVLEELREKARQRGNNEVFEVMLCMLLSDPPALSSCGAWFCPLFCSKLLRAALYSGLQVETLSSAIAESVESCCQMLENDENLRIPISFSDLASLHCLVRGVIINVSK